MSSLTKVALVQMKMDADPKKNLSKAIEKIKLAKKKGARIVCLPELFLTHYFCQEENHDNFAIAGTLAWAEKASTRRCLGRVIPALRLF